MVLNSVSRTTITISLVVFTLLTGCSASKSNEPKELKPTGSSTAVDPETPEVELFRKGKRLYGEHLYSVAQAPFDALALQYPMGPYGEFAAIKAADCRYESGDSQSAAQSYEQFINSYPLSSSTPYALIRAAQSHLAISKGPERDPSPLTHALEQLEKLLEKYPHSIFEDEARRLKREVVSQLAEHERLIGSFYESKSASSAASARIEVAKIKYDSKLETLDASTSNPASQVAALIPPSLLAATFRRETSEVRENAPKVDQSNFGKQIGQDNTEPSISPNLSSKNRIKSIECNPGMLTVTLNDMPLRSDISIESTSSLSVLHLKNTTSRDRTVTCEEGKNVELRADGTILLSRLVGEEQIILTNFPPRILVRFERQDSQP